MKNIIITVFVTIIFTIIVFLYASGIILTMLYSEGSFLLIGMILIIFIGLVLTLVYNMYNRIKEIKEEEKDDLSKY